MPTAERVRDLLKKRRGDEAAASVGSSPRGAGVLDRIRKRLHGGVRSDVAPGGALADNDAVPQDPAPQSASPDQAEAAKVADQPAPKEEPAAPRRKNPYRSDRARPVPVMERLTKRFGLNWVTWEPEALWHAVFDRYGTEPTRPVKDMIGAVRTLLTSEAFWHEPHVFLWTCAGLNRRTVDFRSYPELDPAEVMYAIAVVDRIRDHKPIVVRGRTIDGVTFGPEVEATIAAVFMNDGMVYVPSLPGADALLLERLDPSIAPLHDRVRDAWARLGKKEPIPKLPEDDLGVQLSKLFAIREFVKGLDGA